MIRSAAYTFLIAIILFVARPASAIDVVALTDTGHLLTFDSATPGTITNDAAITGIFPSYTLVGIAYRMTTQTIGAANPGKGTLWGVALNGASVRFYQLNSVTGAATLIGSRMDLDQGSVVNGGWFFGHDPGTDRFRLMGHVRNFEIDPNTMTITRQGDLADNTAINGSAFSSSAFGGDSKPYFLLQVNTASNLDDALFTSTNIKAGNFTPVGATGVDFTQPAGLAIYGSYSFMATWSGGMQQLYSVNLTTGAATGGVAISGSPATLYIYSIAIKPSFGFAPPIAVKVAIKGPKTIKVTKNTITIKGTATSDAGIKQVQCKVGSGAFKKAKGTTKWSFTAKLKPGVNKIQVQATGGNDLKSPIAKLTVILQ